MRSGTNHQHRWPFVLATSVAALCAMAVAGQAFGEPAPASSPAVPSSVVTGGFTCQIQVLPIYPIPNPEPVEYATRTLISIGFSSTSGVVPMFPSAPGVPPAAGPGFGGRGSFGSPLAVTPPPISGGAGVSNSFDGGTIDDCKGFAETIRAAARRLGCAVSKVSANGPLPLYGGSAQVSFVCEGPVDRAIHTIGELDRVTLTLEPEAGG